MHTSDHLLSAYLARYVRAIVRRKRTFPGPLAHSRRQARPGGNHGQSEARTKLDGMEHGPPRSRTWDEELRSRGYRVTPQRQLVLEAVARLDHATPEEIAASVQQTAKAVNISTIYRTLELLDNLGLVTHTHLNHGAPTYHLASDADHVHLVCQDCGKVEQTTPDVIRPLVTALEDKHGFETNVAHLTVFGRCADCRGKGHA